MELRGRKVDDRVLASKSNLLRAKHLNLYGTSVTDAGIELLRGAPRLIEVHIASDYITDRALAILCELPALESLSLDGVPRVTDEGLVHLQKSPNLAELRLSGTQVTDEGLAYLSGLKQLWSIGLSDTLVTDVGVRILGECPRLGLVGLGRTRVTGVGLASLPNNEHFCLHLDGSPITDEGVSHFARRLTHLQTLSMSDTPITDRALHYLAGLQKLNSLRVKNTNVTDEGAEVLRSLPMLQRLEVGGTQISKACTDSLSAGNRRLWIVDPPDA
jgi:internalin A